MRTLVVDAFDSFVYILRQYLLALDADPVVVRSNEFTDRTVETVEPDAILLGPGPGHPADSGHVPIVAAYGERIPILGVCLGHQAVGLAFGAGIRRADHLVHGKTSTIRHDERGVFDGVPQPFPGMRYHSLVVDEDTLPSCLEVSARSLPQATGADAGTSAPSYVMGLRHRDLPIESVQFHPESVGTEHGHRLLANFLGQRVPRFAASDVDALVEAAS